MKHVVQFAIQLSSFDMKCRAVGIDPEPLVCGAWTESRSTDQTFWDVLDGRYRNELLNQLTRESEDLGLYDDMGCYFDRASLFASDAAAQPTDNDFVLDPEFAPYFADDGAAAITRERAACEAEELVRIARRRLPRDARGERWDVV